MKEDEITNFDMNSIDLDGNYAYALLIDYEIPDDIKLKTDNLPLGMKQEEINLATGGASQPNSVPVPSPDK